MTQQDLMHEVEAVIVERNDAGLAAPMTWVVHEVLGRHQRIEGEDKDLALLSMREHIHRTVHAVLRSRKSAECETEPAQGDLFPGYSRLQRSYTILRAGEQVVVRLETMDDQEIRNKASELRVMAAGAMRHADELEDYAASRQRAVA